MGKKSGITSASTRSFRIFQQRVMHSAYLSNRYKFNLHILAQLLIILFCHAPLNTIKYVRQILLETSWYCVVSSASLSLRTQLVGLSHHQLILLLFLSFRLPPSFLSFLILIPSPKTHHLSLTPQQTRLAASYR